MNILDFFLGISFLLFGMSLMGKNLEKLSGGKLEKVLVKMTSNKLMGVLLGMTVTALIHSSSTTTVMLVGFVNSGIMKLSQSIGIIMGSNIGTTVTAWILSLSGLSDDSFIVTMFKPATLAPVCAFLGILFFMFMKKDKFKNAGLILLGFSLLLYGMSLMSGSLSGLKDNPDFQRIFTMFENPILGILAGALVTAIIQSSTASIGILIGLGNISFLSAFPIIMGQNIGTCATALISSIGANKSAKRVAVVHLSFNIIGTVIFASAFYLIKWIFNLNFDGIAVDTWSIAAVHTIFNLSCTLLFLPFTKWFEKLACKIVKDTDDEENVLLLDDRLLNTPAIALEQCKTVAAKMGELACDSIVTSLKLVEKYDEKIAMSLVECEEVVDKYEDAIGTYLMKVSDKDLTVSESKDVTKLLHCIGDFERISDHSVNLKEVAEEIYNKNIEFSEEAVKEIKIMCAAIEEIVEKTVRIFTDNDIDIAETVEPLEEVIDIMREEMKMNHVERLREGKCTIECGFVFSDFLTNAERTADHCSNIAICILELQEDSYEIHELSKSLRERNSEKFDSLHEEYCDKYLNKIK